MNQLEENKVEENVAKQSMHDDQMNGEIRKATEEKEIEDMKETIVEVKAQREEEMFVEKEEDAIEPEVGNRVQNDPRKEVELWKIKENEEIQVNLDGKSEVGKSNSVKDYGLQPCEFVCKTTLLKCENGSHEDKIPSSFNSHIDLRNCAFDTGWVNMDEFFDPQDRRYARFKKHGKFKNGGRCNVLVKDKQENVHLKAVRNRLRKKSASLYRKVKFKVLTSMEVVKQTIAIEGDEGFFQLQMILVQNQV